MIDSLWDCPLRKSKRIYKPLEFVSLVMSPETHSAYGNQLHLFKLATHKIAFNEDTIYAGIFKKPSDN